MTARPNRRTIALLAAGVTGGVLLGQVGLGFAAVSNTVIRGCVSSPTKVVRIISSTETCGRSETLLEWNAQGPQGIQGIPGEKGDKGDPGEPGAPGTAAVSVVNASETGETIENWTTTTYNCGTTWFPEYCSYQTPAPSTYASRVATASCPIGSIALNGFGTAARSLTSQNLVVTNGVPTGYRVIGTAGDDETVVAYAMCLAGAA